MSILTTLILLITSASGALLTFAVRKRLIAHAIMDTPVERSMHTIPTPRGGGAAVMTVLVIGMLILGALPLTIEPSGLTARLVIEIMTFHLPFVFLLLALIPLTLVSWLDDCKGVSASKRLLIHLFSALVGSLALGDQALLFGGALPLWLDRSLLVVGWAWFMNLYNFMDGIDGLTGVQTLSIALGLSALLSALAAAIGAPLLSYDIALCFLVIGATLGFLAFNWPPAKIFLGDVGSVPLGFLIGYLLLKLAIMGFPAAAALLPLYYLTDSGLTLTRRALRGEKVWQAHREHFYQRAALGAGGALPVLVRVLLANTALFLAALLSLLSPWLGLAGGVMVVALLLNRLSKIARKTVSS